MKILCLYLLLFLIPEIAVSQLEIEQKLSDIDIPELRSHIYKGLPDFYRIGKYERMTYRYADGQAMAISNIVSEGQTYRDWEEFENYLNKILEKVMPEELKKDKGVHAYLVRDGSYNAFMTGSGYTFFNIGLFGYVHDEATIAAIMAHELAHYYKRHSLHLFVQQEKGRFNIELFNIGKKRKRQFSIEMEVESDSLALEWLYQSGYDVKGLLSSYRIMERLEKKQVRQSKYKDEIESTTHPLSKERLENFTQFFRKHSKESGSLFLIGKEQFKKFKEKSKPEILKAHLFNFEFNECLEKAFKFHLIDPDNSIYVYYLMESIRRKCYINSDSWEENFYTSRYFVDYMTKKPKPKMESNLFEKFDLDIFAMGPKDLNEVNAKFYWKDTPKFVTNEQAFDFYSKLGEVLKCKECDLSNALSRINNKEAKNKLLKKYIEHENIEFRQFAIDLMNDSVQKKLSNNKLLVYNDLKGYIKQGSEKIPIRFHGLSDTTALLQLFDSVITSFPTRKSMYFTNLKYSDLEKFTLLKELELFSFYTTITKGSKTKLHILDPRYIRIFYEYDVNEIEFINYLYVESRKGEGKIEEYMEAMNMNYSDLLKQTKRTRFLEVYISSLREVENGVMKTRYYGGEVSLKYRSVLFDQLNFELKNKIHLKDKKFR